MSILNMWILQRTKERNIFSSNKKIHELHIKVYFITKNSFVAEVTRLTTSHVLLDYDFELVILSTLNLHVLAK